MAWSDAHKGEALDLTGYATTFVEPFDKLDISDAQGRARWKAPVHTDMGLGRLQTPPSPVYSIADGTLILRTIPAAGGKWQTANMQTVGATGRGFAQRRGYFEVRAKLPHSRGLWGGFWLLSKNGYTDKTQTRSEIDVVEFYGIGDEANHHSSVHLWPALQRPANATVIKHLARSKISAVGAMDTDYHRYGVLITAQWIIIYMDRRELKRFKLLPEQDTAMYPLLSLFMNPHAKVLEPAEFHVDELRVWAKR